MILDAGIKSILLGCKSLRKLKCVGLKKITDECIDAALSKQQSALDSLYLMDLTMCDYVSDSVLERVKQKHSKITIYNYYREEISLD